MNINTPGILYVVATPIGNLQDMTFRAVDILQSVACIVAEDTRHSQPLMQHYGIATPLTALHEHNERERSAQLIARLLYGEAIALISDAGTPLISDPGFYLVHEARLAGIKVVPIPGACAAIAALSVAGLPTDRFIFEGFLPAKTAGRLQRLQPLDSEPRTMIFYEAPHRILALLEDMLLIFGPDRQIVIGRELTKLFETITVKPLAVLIDWIKADKNQLKGEMVVIVEGQKLSSAKSHHEMQSLLIELLAVLPLKKAVEMTAKISGIKKNEIYDLALTLKKNA